MFRNLIFVLTFLVLVLSNPAARAIERTRSDKAETGKERPVIQQTDPREQEQEPLRIPVGLDEPVDPDTYVIGPSDEFILIMRGPVQKQYPLRVLPEGTVILPNSGAFPAAGFTITQFREKLVAELTRYYKNVQFDCQLVVPRSFVVYVLGEVKKTGAVALPAPFRVSTAVDAAGGMSKNGSLRYIEIREKGETVRTVDLFSFLKLGKVEENPVLKEGQSVYVPAKQARAVITGEVWNTGQYEIRDGETVADLIRLAGGAKNYADLDRITVERYDSGSRVTLERCTAENIDAVELQNRDIVVIPDQHMFGGSAFVRLDGGGGRGGRVYIEDGETLASFLPRYTKLTASFDISEAVIEREREDGTIEQIPVDLKRIAEGKDDGNIPLRNGDVISIPQANAFVYVVGAVVNSGEIEYQHGLPAERYIALAGGPASHGSIDKITIYSSDGVKRKGGRGSPVHRGDTIVVERKFSSYFGSVLVGITSAASLIISLIAVSK